MAAKLQILRSSATGNVPPGGTAAGEPWVNFADMQFGVYNATATPLLPVRYWASTATYAINDLVVSAGQVYRATAANTNSPPPSANWALAGGAVQSFNARTGAVTLLAADLTALNAILNPNPALLGVPTTPTAAPGTNTTQVASTAFVAAAIVAAGGVNPSNANPIMDGVAAPGVSPDFSRNDHVHPSDTTKYDASNPAGYITGAALPAISNSVPLVDSGAGAVGTAVTYARGDHVHPHDPTSLALTGGTMTGQIVTIAPVAAGDAANKNYVDTQISSLALYQGVWNPATNTPPLPATGVAGGYYLASPAGTTAVVHPGIPSGTAITLGSLIIWDSAAAQYDIIAGAGLTTATADARYVQLAGGTMTGALLLNADPVGNLGAATKQYVDNAQLDMGTF